MNHQRIADPPSELQTDTWPPPPTDVLLLARRRSSHNISCLTLHTYVLPTTMASSNKRTKFNDHQLDHKAILPPMSCSEMITLEAAIFGQGPPERMVEQRNALRFKLYCIIAMDGDRCNGKCHWCSAYFDKEWQWEWHQLSEHPLLNQALHEAKKEQWYAGVVQLPDKK